MTIAPPDWQMPLLEVAPSFKIAGNAHKRNAYGQIAQEVVCATLGATPIRINGSYECCFDACKGSTFYEIKSAKAKGGKVVVYDWRLSKERRAGVEVKYAVMCHNCKGGGDLFKAYTSGGLELVVVGLDTIVALAAVSEKRVPKASANESGYNRAGYRDGYRNVPVVWLREAAPHAQELDVQCCGLNFKVTVRTA